MRGRNKKESWISCRWFYLDGLCFTAPCTSHAHRPSSFSFLSGCEGVCVCIEAWRVVGGGQWGYLWFISGQSSKNTVDAASLSHPLCPSHCFSIGLPLCCWHTGKRCPALPMLPSWSWSYSGHMHWLPAKRMNRDQSHSAVLAPPSNLALQLPAFCVVLDLIWHPNSCILRGSTCSMTGTLNEYTLVASLPLNTHTHTSTCCNS